MNKVVMDASAILALLNQEKGSEEIAKYIDQAVISTVNLSEVIAKLAEAGILRPLTKSIGLSFDDRACLVLGITLNTIYKK